MFSATVIGRLTYCKAATLQVEHWALLELISSLL